MKRISAGIFFLLFVLSAPIFSQAKQSVSIVENYKNWKWNNVYVAKNKFISVAVVPDAAGRVLEYNLGEVPSLWINPKLFGKSYAPTDEVKRNEWRNFGGYRLVPIPINNCAIDKKGEKMQRWPPPAIIGDSPYKTKIAINENGVETIEVNSGIQNLPVPTFDGQSKTFIHPNQIDEQIQYKRSLYIEDKTSLVFINHSLKNVGTETIKRGIMISSQHPSRSKPILEDGENFLAYFPFSEKYKLPNGEQYEITATPDTRWQYVDRNRMKLDKKNPEHVKKYYNHGTNWTGEVAPGIFEIHYDYYLMAGFHMVSSESWLCYVNKLNKTVFAKIFEPYNPDLEYEGGVNATVFSSGMETGYLETEVKTPIYTLKSGENFNYKEIHGAAKIASLPVLAVNTTGVTTKKMTFDSTNNSISGEYGVFREGILVLRITTNLGKTDEKNILQNVNPLKAVSFNYSLNNLSQTSLFELFVKDESGIYYLLDTYASEK